uniref:Alpha-L-arabinofuranosidase n=1 Tax=Bionectria ochroleuca TaxID=29856 RepID=A0A8H7MY72_BIOOC
MPSLSSNIALGLIAAGVVPLVAAGPCDIYASGGTPCVAAHSTTRALYSSYTGALYQVKRGSDSTTTNIAPLSAGGVANAATQDSFCSGTTCAPGGFQGPEANGYDNLASATGAPVTLNGQKAYGVFVSPGTGYRNNNANGIATGDAAEGMYSILDGTHYNSGCCFDYGNAETSSKDTGNGHMEAIYFGTSTAWGSGSGNGPWLMADLENGLFSGVSSGYNSGDPSITSRFFTAVVKGGPNLWALRGGNAASGSLSTYYSGIRPTASGYNPMSKEGAIILGIGGDNSVSAQGTWYEGVMTSGYPSDATENSWHCTDCRNLHLIACHHLLKHTRYLAHTGTAVNTQVVTSSSATTLKQQASWTVRTGLGNSACFSFESVDTPGSYIRHSDFTLYVNANDNSKQFKEDATFCPQSGISGQGSSIRSWNYPTRYIRHYSNAGYIASNGGVHTWDSATLFNDDVSWVISSSFA